MLVSEQQNFPSLIKVHLLVSEQDIDSIMRGATIKEKKNGHDS